MNIILSPHFDDAVLSLGGLLAKEGRDTLVATFFAGTPQLPCTRPWDISSGFRDSTEAMGARVLEDKRALSFLGVKDDFVRTYAHLDVQYRRQKGDPMTPEPELQDLIQQQVDSLIREFGSEPLRVFAPGLEVGKVHPDHVMLKRAMLGARASATSNVEFLLYQDLPYAISIMDRAYPRSAWNFFMQKKTDKREYTLLEQNVSNGSCGVAPVIIPLENADMKKKLTAIALYASQINSLGKDLLKRIKRFSAAQAQALSLSVPYCEVAYKLT